MANTVIGIFDKKEKAMDARRQLLDDGFAEENIDISSKGHLSMENASEMEGRATGESFIEDRTPGETYNKEGSLNTEGRPKENEGRVAHFFKSLFSDSDEADNYSQVASRGTVVTVHTETLESAERAADILDECGAINANERALQYRNMTNESTEVGNKSLGKEEIQKDNIDELDMPDIDAGTDTTIPVIEEELEVGKRVVETGGVRVFSRIIEKPVEEHLRLREEHVSVERKPVNRKATASDLENFKEGTIETTESAEIPVVGKEARVVEEVKIKKEVKERDETIRGSVRRQDVNVEKKKKREKSGSDDEPIV